MTCKIGSAALLLGALGIASGAAANEVLAGLAGKRGLPYYYSYWLTFSFINAWYTLGSIESEPIDLSI